MGTMNRSLNVALIIAISCLAIPATKGQAPKSDISALVAAGKVNGETYTNTYFGISITAPKAHFTAPSFVNISGRVARLVDAGYDSPDGTQDYTLGLLANSLENYPRDMTITDYVARVRREMEKEGLSIQREGVSVAISGVHLTGLVVLVLEKPNFGFYRGIYSGFMNGHAVSFVVQCPKEERLQEILSSSVKIYPN
jgi:hypothetical protein